MCVCVWDSLCQEIEIRVCSCLFEAWGPLMELTDGKPDAFHFHFPLQEDHNHIIFLRGVQWKLRWVKLFVHSRMFSRGGIITPQLARYNPDCELQEAKNKLRRFTINDVLGCSSTKVLRKHHPGTFLGSVTGLSASVVCVSSTVWKPKSKMNPQV